MSAAFQSAEGTLAAIYSIDQIVTDPQIVAREAITRVPDSDFGEVAMQAVVLRFMRDPVTNRCSAGALGCDTDEILTQWLGMSPDDQERLRSAGAI